MRHNTEHTNKQTNKYTKRKQIRRTPPSASVKSLPLIFGHARRIELEEVPTAVAVARIIYLNPTRVH